MKYPKQILMISPDYFDVIYEINAHMNQSNKINKNLALTQWSNLKELYTKLKFEVITLEAHSNFPDMVFCANQIFTTPINIYLSNMRHEERKGEVSYIKEKMNLINAISVKSTFEAMGDFIWDYEGERIFAGYGKRTEKKAIDEVAKNEKYEFIPLELINENFYHLDTCLSIIDEQTALFVKSAFQQDTINTLKDKFKNLIEVDEQEALQFLACNAHCPDHKNVIVEKNAKKLTNSLKKLGFKVHRVDTSEYLKSGGSIFCLKNQGWFR